MELQDRRDDMANGPLVRDDAQRCMDVIDAFQRATNELDLWGIEYLEPRIPSQPLNINGVEISVNADAICRAARRDGFRVGQADWHWR